MENNQAFVAHIGNIRPIDGADRIVKASVILKDVPVTEVIVSKDTIEGQLVAYFDSNMCLEKSTILEKYPELGNYLGKQGRVKTIKLKGTYSDGLAVDAEKFIPFFKDLDEFYETFVEGYSFTEIGSNHICHKYAPPQKVPSKSNKETKGKKMSRLIEGQFHFHIDTQQLARNIHEINPEDVIGLTSKVHGTSSICSRVLVKRKLSLLEKLAKTIGLKVVETEYDTLYSSRRVVKNDAENPGGFYSSDIWTDAGKTFADKLATGETAYFEILGYIPNTSSMIQKHYDYGCRPGEYRIELYRMTKTGVDGHVTEYGWPLVKERAVQIGIPHVKEYYFGRARDLFPELDTDTHWHENFLEKLREKFLEKNLEGNLCRKVPDEGIVLRVEAANIQVYKLKSLKFLTYETKMAEEDTFSIEDES